MPRSRRAEEDRSGGWSPRPRRRKERPCRVSWGWWTGSTVAAGSPPVRMSAGSVPWKVAIVPGVENERPPFLDVAATREVLEQSLGEGLMSVDRIAGEESGRTGLPSSAIASYLRQNIQYHLGRAESDSLRVFYRMSREEGLLSGGGAGAGLRRDAAAAESAGPAALPLGTAGGSGTSEEPRPLPRRGR